MGFNNMGSLTQVRRKVPVMTRTSSGIMAQIRRAAPSAFKPAHAVNIDLTSTNRSPGLTPTGMSHSIPRTNPTLSINAGMSIGHVTPTPHPIVPTLAPASEPIPSPSIDLSDSLMNRSPGLLPQWTPPGEMPVDMPFPNPTPLNHGKIAAIGGVGFLILSVGLYLVLKRK